MDLNLTGCGAYHITVFAEHGNGKTTKKKADALTRDPSNRSATSNRLWALPVNRHTSGWTKHITWGGGTGV